MSLLFDVSPDEPTRKRGSQKRTGAPQAASEKEPEKKPFFIGELPTRAILPIGMIEHTYDCADAACGTQCHDILHEDGGDWYLSCVFCGTGQWVKAIKGHLKPQDRTFVLRDGRFAGLTLPEVEKQPRGRDYLKWAAESHPRPTVREACKKHLDTSAATR
jgi:hypothetical protein